jgi:hypothetical protein
MTRRLLMTAAIVAIAPHRNCRGPRFWRGMWKSHRAILFPRADCRRIERAFIPVAPEVDEWGYSDAPD